LASLGFTAFDDLIALAVGIAHGNEHHFDLLYEKAAIRHICGKSANLKHDPAAVALLRRLLRNGPQAHAGAAQPAQPRQPPLVALAFGLAFLSLLSYNRRMAESTAP